jgi:hypothetical protein
MIKGDEVMDMIIESKGIFNVEDYELHLDGASLLAEPLAIPIMQINSSQLMSSGSPDLSMKPSRIIDA